MNYTPPRVRIKNIIRDTFPDKVFQIILKIWRNTGIKLIKQPEILSGYQKQFISENGLIVVGGPFKGMRYVDQSVGSIFLTKLVGSYEEVLHNTIEQYKKGNYDTIIDIGCAEGYYLIGLGMHNKNAKLVGYDLDQKALDLTKELHQRNSLTNRLKLEQDCTFEKLNGDIEGKTLVISDCEGFEGVILDPIKATSLKIVQTLLVELHDFAYPNIKKTLTDRFSATHDISIVKFKHAHIESYPFLQKIENKMDCYYILYERVVQDQEWLIMEKR